MVAITRGMFSPLQPGELWTHVRAPLVVAAAYFLAAEAAFFIGTLSDRVFAPFWPPNIVLFCALLITPPRRWWLYILTTFPAHAVVELGVGMDMPQLVAAFVTNCAVAAVNAYAMQQLVGGAPWLDSLKKATLYIVITAVVSPSACALGGAFVPILGDGQFADYWVFWMQWYLANAMTSVTLGPIALLLFCEGKGRWRFLLSRRGVESLLVGAWLFVVCTIAFQASASRAIYGLGPAILYLPLPLILWSAARFGGKGVSVAIFFTTIAAIWTGIDGPSPFAADSPDSTVVVLQTFLIGLAAPLILLGAAVDEARHAETTVREAEARMAFAAASANIGLWQISDGGRDFWATDFCRAMLGLPAVGPVQWGDVLRRVPAEDREPIRRTINDALQSGDSMSCEFRLAPAGKAVRWLTMTAHAERDESLQPLRISGFFSDVTQRKAVDAEMELQRRELAHLMRVSMMGELSGALAHELNQPLTAIRANAEAARRMLARARPVLSDVVETLDDIVRDDNRASEVIQRIHRLLKKGSVKTEPVDINELVTSTLGLVHSQLTSRRIDVRTRLADDLPMPQGDPVQLQQVFLNVVMNAIEAMSASLPSRRVLSVETCLDGDGFVIVTVADQGYGLTEDQQARIFEPFYTTKEHGLGLGLAICSTIITSHGGEIRIADNGGGVTATVSLPAPEIMMLEEAV